VRSMSDTLGWSRSASPALAGYRVDPAGSKVLLRRERVSSRTFRWRIPLDRPPPIALEIALTLGILLAAGGIGAVRGGQYETFVERHGTLSDIVARHLGFGIDKVTISGITHLDEPRILSLAGITAKNSLPFFDVTLARGRLEADPLVKQARVRKLYPDQIVIDIVERTPYAVWQKDGDLRAIGIDGGPIDQVRDARYIGLPFVVGDAANLRVKEFTSLLGSLEELRPRVEAGVLVGQRRWNIHLKSGIDIKLPEASPQVAIATLLKLERQSRILERDVLSVDLRAPGRVFVRLSQESADAWAAAHAPKKAGQP